MYHIYHLYILLLHSICSTTFCIYCIVFNNVVVIFDILNVHQLLFLISYISIASVLQMI